MLIRAPLSGLITKLNVEKGEVAAVSVGIVDGEARVGHPGGGEGRYNLTVSINVQNLFNNVNSGAPVGNLSSPLFGQSTFAAGGFGFGAGGAGLAGNRRVELQMRFSF